MMAKTLASNGAIVYILGRRLHQLQSVSAIYNSPRGKLIPVQCDVLDRNSIKSAADVINTSSNYVNVLINNAGAATGPIICDDPTDVTKVQAAMFSESVEEFDRIMSTNVRGAHDTTAVFLPLLAQGSREGKYVSQVVTISSVLGVTKDVKSKLSYSLSKAAGLHLGKSLSNFLLPLNIRSNVLAPG